MRRSGQGSGDEGGDGPPVPAPFWASPIETVAADRRLRRFGPNRSSDTRRIGALGLLLSQFRSPLVILLLFATTLWLFLGETTNAVIALAIVLGSALLGFLQESRWVSARSSRPACRIGPRT